MNRRKHDQKLLMPRVTSYTIIENLRTKEFSSVLEDIKILTSSEQKLNCYEVCNLLKAFYPLYAELQTESGKKLLLDLLLPSIELCIDFARTHFSCSDLAKDGFMKTFYHFIRMLLNVGLYDAVFKYGFIFKNLIEDTECSFEEKNAYIEDFISILYRTSLNRSLNPETNLELRKFTFELIRIKKYATSGMAVADIVAFVKYIKATIVEYIRIPSFEEFKIQHLMQNVWNYLIGLQNNYNYKTYLFKQLMSWITIFLYFKELTFTRHFIPWLKFLTKSCTEEETLLKTCCELSKICIKFFNLQESGLIVKECYENFSDFFENVKTMKKNDAEMVKCMVEFIFGCFYTHTVKFVKTTNIYPSKLLEPNIKVCGTLVCYHIASDVTLMDGPVELYLKRLNFSCIFLNLYIFRILCEEKDEKKENLLLSEAKPFLNFIYSTLTQLQESSTTYKFITDYATRIRNFGFMLYNKKLYYESIYFFTMNVKLLLKFKSLPEFNMKETQEAFGPQTLECSVYAFLKYAKYEEALRFVADTLTICQNKTKECFDSWMRVKKEAARNGYKGVTSKIISDVLQETDTDIQPDKEIVYLIEEYKLCKCERSYFEEEMLVVYQRLLDMPLSNFDRAYLYLESLTVETNVSEKLSAILKKPLSEICQECIDLLTDCIAKNPQHSLGKLHLSIAYFWIYENNLKKIYEIAEKESQKILKPPSPKPSVGIQNDVEEENDTCDIQPVHHLVSLSVETECFKHLNLAVKLWEDISEVEWQTMSATVKAENVCDMIQATAETYSTAVHDLKELKLWILLRSISMAVDSKIHLLTSSLSLANFLTRLGYLNMSLCILEEIKDTYCFGSESEIEKARFELARANYFLHAEKFDNGLDILRDILKSPDIKKPQKASKMLWVETMSLLGEFLVLPTKAYSRTENIKFLVESSPFAALMEAVMSSKSIMKHLMDNQLIFANHYDWIHFKQKMIRALLRAHILLGDLYFKSGEPHYATSILQDSLKVAESHILTYWSSKTLLILGEIDFICDNFKDCHVKESGLKYILFSSVAGSPDYGDELILPLSKQNLNSKFSELIQHNFDIENFSISILKLQVLFFIYLSTQKNELNSKKAVEIIQVFLNHCFHLKPSKILYDTLKLVSFSFKVEEPFSRSQTRSEIVLNHSIHIKKIELFCSQNDILNAERTVKESIDFLEKALKQPKFSFPDFYATLKYQDIQMKLCDFYKISSKESIIHHLCPTVKPFADLNKSPKKKSGNLPNSPVKKSINQIEIYKIFKQKNKAMMSNKSDSSNNTNSQQPISSRTRSKMDASFDSPISILQDSPVSIKMDELIKDIVDGFSSIPERKASIANFKSSPLDKSKEADLLAGSSKMGAQCPGFSADMRSSDNVLTPLQNTQKKKIENLIEILCKDLSSLSLRKSESHILAGNLDEILGELTELRLLLENSYSYQIYKKLCKLFAVLLLANRKVIGEDERMLHSSFLLSEAFSVSLRSFYIGRVLYYKEPEFLKERQLVINMIKGPYSNMDLQMESFLSAIPDNWSVVQICAFFGQENLETCNSSPFPTKFLITQYHKNSKPIIVGTDCSSGEKSSANVLMEFERIMSETQVLMLNKDIATFWTRKFSLNKQLMNLMRKIENIWLGCWKGFFLGLPDDGERIQHISCAVKNIKNIAPCENEELLVILIDSAQFLTSEQICTAVCYLWNCIHTNDIHIKLCKNIRQLSTALPNTGRHPLILILDQSVQDIPWESMPIAKGVPISRMPSLSLLHLKLRMMLDGTVMDRGFDSSRTFYVLNPAGDLIHSEQFLQDQFKRQKNWKGIIGEAPTMKEFISGMKDHDFFIFYGDGNVRKYLKGAYLNNLMVQSTLVLIGGNIGKLKRLGQVFEAGGIVLKLLLRGCPSVVANLWNVTDEDIDRFTNRFLQYLIPNYDDVTDMTYNIAKSVSLARSACKMVHLVGAAPVVYGLPVYARLIKEKTL